jgi:hypothetical protein
MTFLESLRNMVPASLCSEENERRAGEGELCVVCCCVCVLLCVCCACAFCFL